jgi:hypothetical protein
MPMQRTALAALVLTGMTAAASAQAPSAPLTARTSDLVAVLNGSGSIEALFAPPFLAQVPATQVAAIAKQLAQGFGKAAGVARLTPTGAGSGTLTIAYERGTVDMTITLDPTAPNRIAGLLITGSSPSAQAPAQVVEAFRAFPGKTGFTIARLGGGVPQMLAGSDPDRPLAIGSAFKLVILAELVRATEARERSWSDTVTLDGRELPGGTYTQMPAGTKVGLRELAQKMISISDNSATDILLAALGRERVEAMMPVIGIKDPARNRPFLTTLEMFKIKGVPGGKFGTVWPTLDEAGKRALLKQVDAMPNSAIDSALFAAGKPLMIEQAEWFFSPSDLVRTMDWLRKHSEGGPGVEARAILGINPGIQRGPGNAQWSYIGYKGGSEPGVIAMAFLLQGKDGWYAIAGAWNNSAAAVEDGRFAALMMSAIGGAGK